MAKESNNMGSICLLLFFAAIILIIIYFYSSRKCVKNTGTLGGAPVNEPMDNIGGEEGSHPVQHQQQQPEQQPVGNPDQQPVQNELNLQHGKPSSCS